MTKLSPAAQAVVNAYTSTPIKNGAKPALAAVLRAAADQSENLYDPHEGKVSVVRVEHLIAIANELETQ